MDERQYYWMLHCPCGTSLEGSSEDEIVDLSLAHLREEHPDMADVYEREHILFMAQRFVST
jgi:predicted small metal-binding protein